MKRMVCAAAGCGLLLAATGRAQTPASAERMTVTGCVERAHRNGSLAGTDVGATASPNTAPTDANSPVPLNVFLLTDAVPAAANAKGSAPSASAPSASRFALDGHDQELSQYVAHRVEITGRVLPPRSSGRGATQSGLASGTTRLAVESLKPIAGDCSPAKPQR